MTKEMEKHIALFEEAKKYSDGLPKEERSAERTVGYYDCLVRCMPLVKVLKAWEEWEAGIIADDNAWPKNQMTINGEHYNKMLELQIQRNAALQDYNKK